MTPWSNIYFALIMESRLLWNIGFYPLFLHVVSCIFVVESGELYFKQLFFMVKLVKLAITWILIFLGWHQSPQPVCRPQGDWVATANGIHKPMIFATHLLQVENEVLVVQRVFHYILSKLLTNHCSTFQLECASQRIH